MLYLINRYLSSFEAQSSRPTDSKPDIEKKMLKCVFTQKKSSM